MALSDGLLLDTHVWVWIASGLLYPDPALIKRMKAAAVHDQLFLSAISLYEIANAAQRGRLNLVRNLEDWFTANLAPPGVRVIALTPEIAVETTRLPVAFHGDPGDRLIAATARAKKLTVVTHDKALLRFGKQGLFTVLKARRKKDAG